jgi:anti-sigma regulatory factor (Ser/Thr protein kinase)
METLLGVHGRQTSYPVRESSEIAAARRAANELARQHGLDETAAGRVALVVMEAGTNIVKHAREGQILLRPVTQAGMPGVEVIALDGGPGIANLAASMRDGTSTAGSYGVGLGAMRRMADEFDVYSSAGKGTVIWMTVWAKQQTQQTQQPAPPWQLGVVCLPLAGETVCGDAWGVCGDAGKLCVMVADGLGHGPIAAEAAEAATSLLADCLDLPPAALMQNTHGALRSTRGAAVAIAHIDCTAEQVSFAGIGNIAACVVGNAHDMHDMHDIQRRQLISHNGIVGINMRRAHEVTVPWSARSTLILHSDGLGTRWALEPYPGLLHCHPAVIAAVLYRDFTRGRDDVTVLVIRTHPDFSS